MTKIPFRFDSQLAGKNLIDQQLADTTKAALQKLLADSCKDAAFLEVPFDSGALNTTLAAIKAVPARFTKVLVLGIGGSALGTQAALEALKYAPARKDKKEVRVLSNLDPASISDMISWFDPKDTLLVPITKSGTTVETLTQFSIFTNIIRESLGDAGLRDGMVAITDPERGALRQIAIKTGCQVLDVPPRVGGRFSVLTPVGLFPIGLAGYDIEAMLGGAAAVLKNVDMAHPSVQAAAGQIAMMKKGASIRVFWAYSDRLAFMGDWLSQLWGESLGKPGKDGPVGQTPLRAIGSTDQHSLLQLFMEGPKDKIITFVTTKDVPVVKVPDMSFLHADLAEFANKNVDEVFDALRMGTTVGLFDADRPVFELQIDKLDEATVGALFTHFMIETALAGYILQINPFDQPGVEAGKKFAHGILGRPGMESFKARVDQVLGG
ncbi:MAG TPA: glucose-6-phosphate isomerase [Myxococcota bacterium]|jgi:glucose-6-phosphate isomerase|nr:glucose-6-phosphate isomerase [Myxococcota bacterium]HHW96522.1 glucose-6-phosphate isomerase [Oligoflexales bacterium]HQC44708.1 glucose-6-phosphate isomerase [Myxococcota bacterium]HQL57526.1 glucose-6-phosphate isomerase [Myxococcota bacterium]